MMPLKFFEFQEQYTIGAFLTKNTQIEKKPVNIGNIGSIGTFFIPLGNLKIKFNFRN